MNGLRTQAYAVFFFNRLQQPGEIRRAHAYPNDLLPRNTSYQAWNTTGQRCSPELGISSSVDLVGRVSAIVDKDRMSV